MRFFTSYPSLERAVGQRRSMQLPLLHEVRLLNKFVIVTDVIIMNAFGNKFIKFSNSVLNSHSRGLKLTIL